MKTTKRILSLLLCMALVLGMIPVFASAAVGDYTLITSADQLVSGKYVMISDKGYAPGAYDGSWLAAKKITVTDNSVTAANASGYVYTLTVSGSSVKLQDPNGKYIAPKSGNDNGIQNKEYSWAVSFNASKGAFQFKGTGSDNHILASNTGSDNKFRAYKNTTVSNNAGSYPSYFKLYKLVEATGDETCEHANLDATKVTHDNGVHADYCVDCEEHITSSTYKMSIEKGDADGHITSCSCGAYSDTAPHTYGDWYEKTPATYQSEGVMARICSYCQFEETKPIDQKELVDGKNYIKYTDTELVSGTYILVTANGKAMGVYDNGNSPWITVVEDLIFADDNNTVTYDGSAAWTLTVTGNTVTLTDSQGTTIKPKGTDTNGIAKGAYSWTWTCNDDGVYTFAAVTEKVTLAANVQTGTSGGLGRYRAYKDTTITGDKNGYYLTEFTLYKLEDEAPACSHETKIEYTTTHHTTSCSKCGEVFVDNALHTIGEDGTCPVCHIVVDEQALTAAVLEAIFALKTGEKLDGTYTLTGTVTVINYEYNAEKGDLTLTMAIEGYEKTIYCFYLKCTAEQNAQLKVGSVITVKGAYENYGGKYELNRGTLIAIADHEHAWSEEGVYTEPTFEADGFTTYTCACGEKNVVVNPGTQLIAVAKIGDKKFVSIADAFAAAVANDTVVLLTDATIETDTTLAAGVTYEVPAGLTLTVAEGATVIADAAATLNCAGTIIVAGNADISALVYGGSFGAKGGKLTIKATGSVVMLKSWEGIWTPLNDAQLGSMLLNCENGAAVSVGAQNWQLTSDAWVHLNHAYTAEQTKAPTCADAGITTYTCACGDTYSEEIPATGIHTYDNDQDADCNVCGDVREVKAPGTITANGHSLSLEGNIWINKYVLIEGFEGIDIEENGGLLIWNEYIAEEDAVFGAGNPIVKELVYNGLYNGVPEYGALTDGIKAPFYGNKLYMRAYVKVGDTYYYGGFSEYSVEDYCLGRIEKSKDAELKKLCAAVLEYGAMAQIRFSNVDGVITDRLINENLDSTLKTEYNSNMIVALDEEFETQITAADTAIVKSNGRSISLNEGLLINYYFKTTLTNIQSAELLTWRGVEGELTYENATKTELIFASGEYAAQGELVPAPFCGDTIYACARFVDANGVEYYTAVSAYSTHQYASNQLNKTTTTEADRNLLKALLVYSSLANAKFAK